MGIKKVLGCLLLLAGVAFAQTRYDSVSQGLTANNLYTATPGATVLVYNFPGGTTNCSGGGCTPATTYNDSTLTTSCAAATPLTRLGSTTCFGQVDAGGNFGFWAAPGLYQYCITATGFGTSCTNVTVGSPFTVGPGGNIQAAMNACPSTGCTILIAPSTTEYACPTSIPNSNIALIGLGAGSDFNFVGSILTPAVTTSTQVGIGPCGSITIAAGTQNLRLSHLTLDYNNSGNGFSCVSCSFMEFSFVTFMNAGGVSTPAVSLTSTGASGLNNSIRNVFDHVSITCSGTHTCNSALFLNGSASTGVTDNEFTDIAISGSPKCGIDLEKNTDSNHFVNGNYIPDVIVANSAPFCFNLTASAGDIDADASSFINWNITGSPTWMWNAGQSQGHIFLGVNSGPPVSGGNFHVAGGNPNLPLVIGGLGGTGSVNIFANSLQISDEGNCTMAAGACTLQSFNHNYASIPPCVGSWAGVGTLAGQIKMLAGTNGVTPTSTVGTDTAQISWACFGH